MVARTKIGRGKENGPVTRPKRTVNASQWCKAHSQDRKSLRGIISHSAKKERVRPNKVIVLNVKGIKFHQGTSNTQFGDVGEHDQDAWQDILVDPEVLMEVKILWEQHGKERDLTFVDYFAGCARLAKAPSHNVSIACIWFRAKASRQIQMGTCSLFF